MGSEPIPSLVAGLRAAFADGRTRPLPYRQRQLAGLGRFLVERERQIEEALSTRTLANPPWRLTARRSPSPPGSSPSFASIFLPGPGLRLSPRRFSPCPA